MAEELKACGKNGYGETFWKLCVPDEHCSPGLEVGISAGERGLTIGGRLLNWAELDQSRAQLHSQGGEAVAMRQRFSQIEDEIMDGKHTAASVFTQMRTAALYTHPADQVAEPDADKLAQFIRQIDGDNRMGAGALAEHICEWLAKP